jgi:hypothetical protein
MLTPSTGFNRCDCGRPQAFAPQPSAERLGRCAKLPRANRPLLGQADNDDVGPGWMASRLWWFVLGVTWGALVCGIATGWRA